MENQNNEQSENKGSGVSPSDATIEFRSKYAQLYQVLDAVVDTTNLAENRKNAIKFGLRAVGEIVSEFPHEHGHTLHETAAADKNTDKEKDRAGAPDAVRDGGRTMTGNAQTNQGQPNRNTGSRNQ